MNKGLLCIGSNKDKEVNLSLCCELLNKEFTNISYSSTSVTAPYGNTYKGEFLNRLAIIYTIKDREQIQNLLKQIEKEMGRMPADKDLGVVKIDIDLVIWNDIVIKPKDYARSYVADLLATITIPKDYTVY